MSKPSDQPNQLQPVLSESAEALSDISKMLHQFETWLLDVLYDSAILTSNSISVQNLDRIIQSVDDISAMLSRLADDVPGDIGVDHGQVISPMKLQRLQDAMSKHFDDKRPQNELAAGSGVISLF